MDQIVDLSAEKRRVAIAAKFGMPFTITGAIYWLALGIAGFCLPPRTWALVAFFASGAIYPLSMAIAKIVKANVNTPSPLNGAMAAGFISMLLMWPITIAAFFHSIAIVPLALGIGMSIHLPIVGWVYGTNIVMAHVIARAMLVSAIWFLLPNARFTLLPLVVAGLYLATSIVLDAKRHRVA